MVKRLAGILLSIGLSACIPSNNNNNNKKQCASDYDCLETEVCESGRCEANNIDNNSPQRTLDQFVAALESSNLESALGYIQDNSKDIYRQVLSGNASLPEEFQGFAYGQNMEYVANILKSANLRRPTSEFGNRRDYEYSCPDTQGNNYLCCIRFIQENGNWKIKNF